MTANDRTGIDSLLPGQQFEQYTLLERIASGGEGVIWTAWDPALNRVAAIKMSPIRGQVNKSSIEQEVEIISKLDHPMVIKAYHSGFRDNLRYMAMQYFPFGSLSSLLSSGKLPTVQVLLLLRYLAEALDYIHTQGVVHRDLKPTNILLDSSHRTYLSDFGIARTLSASTAILHTGRGTAPYSPPEQHSRSSVTYQSDIYSLGLIAYEMLTGHLPFDGDASLAILQISEERQLPDPRDLNPALPVTVGQVLRRLTAKDQEDRPTSALKAWDLLAAALDQDDLAIKREPFHDAVIVQRQDADWIINSALPAWQADESPVDISLSDFALMHMIYASDRTFAAQSSTEQRELMLYGAFTHDFGLDHWWQQVSSPSLRREVCARIIEQAGENATARVLKRLLASTPTSPLETSSRLAVDLARLLDSDQAEAALTVLVRDLSPADHWQPSVFSVLDDLRIARMALSSSPAAQLAARLIGIVRSETAADEVAAHLNGAENLAALDAIQQAAGSLPGSLVTPLRLRVWFRLTRKQLLEDPAGLLRSYLGAALGYGLALGIYVFVFYRWASFLDNSRILNAVGSGLVFGPVMGLGGFVARLLPRRLVVLPQWGRVLLGGGLGALLLNLGVVGFHTFYLNAAPVGFLIATMSFVLSYVISIAETFIGPRIVRVGLSVLVTAAILVISWELYLLLNSSPVLYFDFEKPVETGVLIFVTSLLMGSFLYAGSGLEYPDKNVES